MAFVKPQTRARLPAPTQDFYRAPDPVTDELPESLVSAMPNERPDQRISSRFWQKNEEEIRLLSDLPVTPTVMRVIGLFPLKLIQLTLLQMSEEHADELIRQAAAAPETRLSRKLQLLHQQVYSQWLSSIEKRDILYTPEEADPSPEDTLESQKGADYARE